MTAALAWVAKSRSQFLPIRRPLLECSFSDPRVTPRQRTEHFPKQNRKVERVRPTGSRVALLWLVMPCIRRVSRTSGFTLVEVLIAVAILVTIALGVAQLIVVATHAIRAAREQTSAVILAAAKMDQLRSLAWAYEPSAPGTPAVPRSDRTTDVSHPDHASRGGGLAASPAGTLSTNVPPYVDYLDGLGRWVGNGTDPPAGALFIRRWAVRPLPADPERMIVLQVLVTTVRDDRSRTTPWRARTGADALLVSVRTRKGQ